MWFQVKEYRGNTLFIHVTEQGFNITSSTSDQRGCQPRPVKSWLDGKTEDGSNGVKYVTEERAGVV